MNGPHKRWIEMNGDKYVCQMRVFVSVNYLKQQLPLLRLLLLR